MINNIKLPPQEWLGYDPERGDIHGYTFEQMREFAELIVRECVGLVNEQLQHNNPNDSLLALKIKEHFGVEE